MIRAYKPISVACATGNRHGPVLTDIREHTYLPHRRPDHNYRFMQNTGGKVITNIWNFVSTPQTHPLCPEKFLLFQY